MKRNKFNQVQTLSCNDDRNILNLLEVGDYVECYNGYKGTFMYFCEGENKVNLSYDRFRIDVHILDVKSIIFVKSSWTREEVEELINKHTLDNVAKGGTNRVVTKEWIEENL